MSTARWVHRFLAAALLGTAIGCDTGESYWRPEFATPDMLDADGQLAFYNYLIEHANDRPPSVSDGNQAPRLRWADGSERPVAEEPSPAKAREAAQEVRDRIGQLPFKPLSTARMVAFVSRAKEKDVALAAAGRRWLAHQSGALVASYQAPASGLSGVMSDALWRDGVRAWAGWINSDFDRLNDEEKLIVISGLFPCSGRGSETGLDAVLDRFALAERVVARWVSRDSPAVTFSFDPKGPSLGAEDDGFDWRSLKTEDLGSVLDRKVVLGPTDCRPSHPWRSRPLALAAYMAPTWISFGLTTPERTSRLVHALVGYRDAMLFSVLLDAIGRERWSALLSPFQGDARVMVAMNQAVAIAAGRREPTSAPGGAAR